MNAIYLIIIALGFTAGATVTFLKSDKPEPQKVCIEKVEEKTNCSADDQIIKKPESKPDHIYLIIE